MMKCNANIGRVALLLCNFLFLLSGFCLILLGCVALNDSPRILLSSLALEPGTLPEPLLYYVSLGFVTAGIVISLIAVLGCWTSLGPDSDCLIGIYVFFLVTLLLFEMSVGVVGTFCPQAFGAGMDRDEMVSSLMNNYGVPGRDKYTAAVDLAQTIFECCGMQSGSDYDGSRWWKREQDSNHELRVPRSCCFLQNTNNKNAFLDPLPVNLTLCQAKNNARYQLGRHVKGCIDQLNQWFKEHVTIFLIIGMALIVVQLSVLLCAIIFCLRRRKASTIALESEDSSESSSQTKQKAYSNSNPEPKPESKNLGNNQENGFPVISNRPNQEGKQTNSKRTNYAFRNLNFMDSEEFTKRKDGHTSSVFVERNDNFPYFDENRNNPRSLENVVQESKFYEEQRNPEYYFSCTPKIQPVQNSLQDSDFQYEAMRHYFIKSNNDVSSANNGRNCIGLGT